MFGERGVGGSGGHVMWRYWVDSGFERRVEIADDSNKGDFALN